MIVEAYNILSNPESRKKFDEKLKKEFVKTDNTIRKNTVRPVHVKPADFRKQFENYFGFNPDTKMKVEKKEKVKVKENINTDELFKQYFTSRKRKL